MGLLLFSKYFTIFLNYNFYKEIRKKMIFEVLKHVYKHEWDLVSLASWRKYPSPDRPDCLSVDIIDRNFNKETGVLTAQRFMVMKSQVPSWMTAIVGGSTALIVEESMVDPVQKKMVLTARNVSFQNVFEVVETCTYTTNEDNDKWTDFKQDVRITAKPFGVGGAMESLSWERFKVNAEKGKVVMENAIERVKNDIVEVEQTLTNEAKAMQLKVKSELEEKMEILSGK